MLVHEWLFLSQFTTTSIYSENSSELKNVISVNVGSGNTLILSDLIMDITWVT